MRYAAIVTITHPKPDAYQLKGAVTVTLGPSITVGDYTIDHPGEYDVAGVGVHGFQADGHVLYRLRIEGMRVIWLSSLPPVAGKEVLEEIEDPDILFITISSGEETKRAAEWLGALAPKIVIVHDAGLALKSLDGAPLEDLDDLKVSPLSLPQEERRTVRLSAGRQD